MTPSGRTEKDTRNLVDGLKGLSVEEIKWRLSSRRRPFATLILNIDYDLNISTIIRSHNAFCGQEIFYLGRKKYNRRGCVGTYLYEEIRYFETLDAAVEGIPHYTWVGIDNRPGAIPISEYNWPARPLLVFGQEKDGLDFLPQLPYYCRDVVSIPQTGSVRSLNVGVAAGITMYDLSLKKGWV